MKIITDSAADLLPEEIAAHQITIAPLQIQFPEETISAEEISRDDFYSRLKAMWPQVPTTSLPSAGIFAEMYRKLAAADEKILSIHISSGLSNTINSARTGASEAPNIDVTHVDTMTLSGGQRHQVLAAALAIEAGHEKEAILARLDKIREATETIFTLETLAYLAKGGRIGRVQAMAGMLLGIKPIIKVDHKDGKYTPAGKERTMKKAINSIIDQLSQKYQQTSVWVSVMHGQASNEADEMASGLRARLNVARLEVLRISPVLGVHTGPGVVGASVVPMNLMEGLSLS